MKTKSPSTIRLPATAGRYRLLATALAYPDVDFFEKLEIAAEARDGIQAEYDRLFRTGAIWLEGAEYLVENEFQRTQQLTDIMAFYHAFGVEPSKIRPDSLTCQLEFMYYLEVKRARAEQGRIADESGDKAKVCRDAQGKFFREHLAPAGRAIADRLKKQTDNPFYRTVAIELSNMLDAETRRHGMAAKNPVTVPAAVACDEWQGCANESSCEVDKT